MTSFRQFGGADVLTSKRLAHSTKSFEHNKKTPVKKQRFQTELEFKQLSLTSPKNDSYPLFPGNYFIDNDNVNENKTKEFIRIPIENLQNQISVNISPNSVRGLGVSPTIRLAKLESKLKDDTHFLFEIENGRETRVLMQRWRLNEFIISFFCSLSIAISVIEYDYEFENNIYDDQRQNILCWISSILTFIILILELFRRKWITLIKKARKFIKQKYFISNLYEFIYLMMEIALILPHPTPFTQDIKVSFHTANKMKAFYKVNEILNLLLLLRILFVARFFIINSSFYGNRAQRTCQFYALNPNYWLTIRCILKNHPYIATSLSLLVIILTFGEAIRICESPPLRNIADIDIINNVYGGMDLREYSNSIWLLWVTITTIGYGDYYPKTSLGRLIVVIVSLLGVIDTSILVATFYSELQLTTLEKNVYNTLGRLKVRDKIKEKAKKIMKYIIRFNRISKFTNKIDYDVLYKVKKSLIEFRNVKRHYKALEDETYNVAEDLAKYFIEIEDKIKNLSVYQQLLRKEIRISSIRPTSKTKIEISESDKSLSSINECLEEDFSQEKLKENKAETISPSKQRHSLAQKKDLTYTKKF